jgi:drug/metabolite transporter (DMT)-like permease
MVAVQLLVSALAAIAWVAWTGEFAVPSSHALLGAAYLGLAATALAFVLQVFAQRFTSATRTALIFTLEPVFAALFAYLIAGETIGPRGLVGCGLILVGMLVAELL